MKRCTRGVAAKVDNSDPNLWKRLNGFGHETGFGALFGVRRLTACSGRFEPATSRSSSRTRATPRLGPRLTLYLGEIEALAQAAQPRVIVCVIPLQLLQSGATDEEDDEEVEQGGPRQQSLAGRFHDILKAEAMRYRVPLQLMRPGTDDPTSPRHAPARPTPG